MAVTLEKPINTKKNSLTNFKFVINFDFKRKKLTPKELIKRCGLDKKYVGPKIDYTKEINNIAYNI